MTASETESNFEVVFLEEGDLAQAGQTGYPDLLGRNDDQHVFGRMEKLDLLVQRFRQKAFHLEEEQASLYLMLATLKNDSDIETSSTESITEKVDELKNMLIGVDLKITTERRKHEEEALHTVNLLIDEVISQVQHDLNNTKEVCYSLLQACQWSLGNWLEVTEVNEASDTITKFQTTIPKCTVDDRNRIGRRLTGLLSYIESLKRDTFP